MLLIRRYQFDAIDNQVLFFPLVGLFSSLHFTYFAAFVQVISEPSHLSHLSYIAIVP